MIQTTKLSTIVTLTLLTALPLMSLNMFLPSLGVMATEFEVGYDTMAFVVSGYLAFTALLQVLSGPVADRFGRRPVLLISLGLFATASIGCVLAKNFETFLLFRVIQGAVITGATLSRAIVSDIAAPKQAASILGYMGMVMSLAPILAPSLGGFLAEVVGWRANFWVYAATGVGLWILVWALLPETTETNAGKGTAFLRSYWELLKSIHFWAYTLIMAFSIGGFYVFISGIPLIAAQQLGMTQSQIGLGMGSITIGFLVGSFLSARLSKNRELNTMIILGRGTATVGLLACLVVLSGGYVTPLILFAGTIFVGLGNGLTMPSASTAVMFVRNDLAASASGLFGAVIVIFGAIFSACAGAILQVHSTAVILVGLMLALAFASLAISIWIAKRPVNVAKES